MIGRWGFCRILGCAAGLTTATALFCGVAAHAQTRKAPPTGFRRLAPGVETTIPAQIDPHDTVTYHNIVELLAPSVVADLTWTPQFISPTRTLRALATNRDFRSTTWYLQFIFKPLRVIQVDLPAAGGRLQRKTVWYMVYRVKDVGGHLRPVAKPAGEGSLQGAPEVQAIDDLGVPIHFFPKFTMEGEIDGVKRVYLDKIVPLAVDAIRKREDPNRPLLNSVEIGAQAVKLSTATQDNSVWGVATWVDVDPRVDFFSVYVTGLTNAYRWTDPQNGFKAGDAPATGRKYTYKTLQLNFWRPGDEFGIYEDQIYMGAPADKVNKPVDPDNADSVAAAVAAPAPKGLGSSYQRNWDKIIDYRWVFR